MKLLDLVSKMEAYGRVKREHWEDRYLVRKIENTGALILCDMDCLMMRNYIFSLEDLTSDDWELI